MTKIKIIPQPSLGIGAQKVINYLFTPLAIASVIGIYNIGKTALEQAQSTELFQRTVEAYTIASQDPAFTLASILTGFTVAIAAKSGKNVEDIHLHTKGIVREIVQYAEKKIAEGVQFKKSVGSRYANISSFVNGMIDSAIPFTKPLVNRLSKDPLAARIMHEGLHARSAHSPISFYAGKAAAYATYAIAAADLLNKIL